MTLGFNVFDSILYEESHHKVTNNTLIFNLFDKPYCFFDEIIKNVDENQFEI